MNEGKKMRFKTGAGTVMVLKPKRRTKLIHYSTARFFFSLAFIWYLQLFYKVLQGFSITLQ